MILLDKKFFFRKFYIWFLSVFLFVALFMAGIFGFVIFSVKEATTQNYINLTEIVVESIKSEYSQASWPLSLLKKVNQMEDVVFWQIVNSENEIFLASDASVEGNLIQKEEFTKNQTQIQKIQYQKQDINTIICPFVLNEDKTWYFLLGLSFSHIQELAYLFGLVYLVVFILAFLIITLIFTYFAKRYHQFLHKFQWALQSLGQDKLDYRIEKESGESQSIKELIENFNHSSRSLQKKRASSLKKIEDLEKFHKLTVDRELKMKELKKENEKLKNEIKQRRQW